MKIFKKLAFLCTALLMTAGLGTATACHGDDTESTVSSSAQSSENLSTDSEESSSESSDSTSDSSDSGEQEETKNFTYRVKVETENRFGLKNVTIRLMDGETEVARNTTSANGIADFQKSDNLPLGNYTIAIENLPKGYALKYADSTYETMPEDGFEVRIVVVPTGVIMETAPIGIMYNLGDVMYDFTVKTSDGNDFTLSEVLQEKEMVMINFWATWCGPCKSEFPAMNNAYIEYQDQVAIIAISTTDTMKQVVDFKGSNGLAFDMTSNTESGANVAGMFNTSGIPVSIMVDRYGVISFYHMGSMTATQDFTSRFDRFLGDDYVPTVIQGSGSNENEGGGEENVDLRVECDMPNPNPDDIKTALGGDNHFTYGWITDDKYSWPWLVTEGGNSIEPGFSYRDGNYSTMTVKVNAKGGNAFSFDYELNTEENSDILYVMVDGDPAYQLSGTGVPAGTPKHGTCTYIFPSYLTEVSEHTIHLIYLKDNDTSISGECVKISNFTFMEDGTQEDGLIFRHAANVVNTDKNATSYYKYYADVVFNETDGYYHVGTENGPILFANLMLSSRWSDTSVWLLAYYDYIVAEGYNFHYDIEDQAWAANQPIPGKGLTYGYTPVTEELKELLVFATMSESVKAEGLKFWTGAWHENEWLEACVYWEHTGDTPALEDPMKTITFHAAEEVFEGQNTAKVLFSMTPRGFKYKFTPTRDGVYHIYSSTKDVDTECFLVAPDGKTFLGNYTDVIGKTYADGTYDYNFYFHHYLEAGQTYYLLMTTYLDQACEYPFFIEYVGETYTYLDTMATGPYSFNEVSFELYIPDAKQYVYNEADGYYHVLNNDGTMGSVIYVDMTRATSFFPNNSLFDTAVADNKKDVTKRNFYINGVDYTPIILQYGVASKSRPDENPMLDGFIELNQELFNALVAITRSERFEGISDSWQMLCYYEKVLGAPANS
ncbi:MAG: TlpA family protein disulfide reductase [Clostridiales bacterium]|nr:TlpA family protein disulfide reductase [Clostridiales bacterium]